MSKAKRPIYVLHPGEVTSKTDGGKHFIDFNRLVRLYGLSVKMCEIYSGHKLYTDNHIHLFPLYEGNYEEVANIETIKWMRKP